MKVRDALFVSAETLTDSFSKTYSLVGMGKIQHIRLKFAATNGGTSNTVGKLHSLVSKIEVVDGSDVLFSCSMLEGISANCFNNMLMPFQDLSAGAAVVIRDEVFINFGRFTGDREFYLDTVNYKNPQLKVTGVFAVSATVGIATGTGALTVIVRIIEDGAPPYRGFIMRKEKFTWTTAASGDQVVELATDLPYMGIIVAALKTTIEPDTILTNFKLTRDTDRYIDFNISGRDAYAKNLEDFGPFRQKFRPLTDTAATWLGDLYFKTGAWFSRPGATAKSITTAVAAESVTTAATTGGTADLTELELEGGAPGAAVYLPFHAGDPYTVPNPDDFLNPSGLGKLQLIVSQGVVSGAASVVTEQVRS